MEYCKVIIAGSRTYNDYKFASNKIRFYLSQIPSNNITIVSGGAKGADAIGERYAKENKIPLKIFPANWEKFKRSAGFIRNTEMANYATHLIAFWDGKSKGTEMMIDIARLKKINTRIVYIK